MAGIGGFISSLFGSNNESTAQKPATDPNAYQYGGYEGGADDAANRYRQNATNAQTRQGVQADYSQANADRYRGQQARNVQAQATGAMLARALGRTPSIAQMAGDRAMGQAVAEQGSQAASARGSAGLALAQQNAANNVANAQSNIGGQTAIAAANERLQAEQAAAGAGAALRGGDLQAGSLAAQQAQYNATNAMQQRELNDRMTLGMTGNEMAVQGMQLGAQQNQQAQNSANSLGAAGINAGVGGQNASMNQTNASGLIGIGAQVAGGYAAGGGGGSVTGKADGGPVEGGRPYLMGERGPEMVVDLDENPSVDASHDAARQAGASMRGRHFQDAPAQPYLVGQNGPEIHTPPRDAVVIPSEVTVPMLARSTWGTGGPDVIAQKRAYDEADAQGQSAQRSTEANRSYVDPYQRVIDREKAGRAAGIMPSENDGSEGERLSSAAEERYAKQMVRKRAPAGASQETEKEEPGEKQAVAEGKALPKQGALSRALGTVGRGAEKMGGIDTAYHGPTQFHGPSLIPVQLPGRALGGPVEAGQPYAMGERGPELVMPHGMGVSPAAGPSFAPMSAGGMNPMNEIRAQSAFATQFQRNPAAPVVAGAREDGGPVKANEKYLVGEKGPEMVMPAMSEATAERMRERDGMPALTGGSGEKPAAAPMPAAPAPAAPQAPETHIARDVARRAAYTLVPEAALGDAAGSLHAALRREVPNEPTPQTGLAHPAIMPLGTFLAGYLNASRGR